MERSAPNPRSFITVAVGCEGGLIVAALGLGWFLERPPLVQIELEPSACWQALVAAAPLVVGLLLIVRYPVGPLRAIEAIVDQLLVPLFRPAALSELLLISALAGLGEEMLFRGAIQAGIQQFSGSPIVALIIASTLFGLAHPLTATYAILAGLIGLYLGWLWLATGNLLVPIVTHAAYDFVALVYLVRVRKDEGRMKDESQPSDESVVP